MTNALSRRDFVKRTAQGAATVALAAKAAPVLADAQPLFKISVAQWSFHRALFGGKMDNLDFAKVAKQEFGIDAIEYVNQFFKDKAKDTKYLDEMIKRAKDQGVQSRLIMIDGEGRLGDPDNAKRTAAVENHYKWLDAAKHLGCFAIRVNAGSAGTYDEQMKLAIDGLSRLSAKGAEHGLYVIVENHGGLSSNGQWLSSVMKAVNNPRCGTLPDFGNFGSYDRYKGVTELMPYAKAVSAKSHEFDDQGNEKHTDYMRMMKIVVDAGFRDYVGIEYEGSQVPEPQGVSLTKKLLVRVRDELAKSIKA